MKKSVWLMSVLLLLAACSGSETPLDVFEDVPPADVVVTPDVDWCPGEGAVASRSGVLPRPVVEMSWEVGMVPAMESAFSGLVPVDEADQAAMTRFESSLGLTRAHVSTAGLAVFVHGEDEWAGVVDECQAAIPDSDEAYIIRWSVDGDGNQVVHVVAPSAAGRLMAWKTIFQLPGNLAGTELFIADAPASKWRGVVETFYGPVYEETDRLAFLPWLADMKFNQYIYAGKMDLYTDWIGTYWPDEWPAEYVAMLGRMVDAVKAEGMTPGVQLRIDAGSVVFSSPDDMAKFLEKIRLFAEVGFELFSLSFDDTQKVLYGADIDAYESYDLAIIDFSKRAFEAIHAEMPDLILGWVSTDYWSGAETAATTLPIAGEQIPPYVSIGWTGKEVVPATITAADADEVAGWIKRKPLLGDNYPVIDNASARAFLGPLQGRAADLPGHLDGILFNPMPLPFASLPALATCADYAWNAAGYDPWESTAAMSRMLGGSGDGAAALEMMAMTNLSSLFNESMAPDLKTASDDFWAQWDAGATPDGSGLALKFAEFAALPDMWAQPGPADELRAELQPWVNQYGRYGQAGAMALEIVASMAAGIPVDAGQVDAFRLLYDEIVAADRRPTGDVMQSFLDRMLAVLLEGPAFVWDSGCEGSGTGASWTPISDSTFLRGPMIQMSDRDTATILWRTAVPTTDEGCVDYGWGDQARTECGPADVNGQYEIRLDRLPPATEISYVARTGDASTANLTFRTMPDGPVPMKFAMFADIHNVEENMRKASATALREGVDFAVAVGDIAGAGLPEEYDITFRGWQDLASRVNVWTVPGNHDEKNIPGYFEAFAMPHGNASEPGYEEGWWSRRIGNVWLGGGWIRDFYLSMPDSDWGEVGWFRQQFQTEEFKTAKWKLFFMHQPAYAIQWGSECNFDGEDCLKVAMVPMLQEAGVQASFHGHMHGIEWGELGGLWMFTVGGLAGTMDADVCEPSDAIPEGWHGLYEIPPMAIVEAGCDALKVRIMDLDGNELQVVEVPEVPVHYDENIRFLSFNLRLPFDTEPGKKWTERQQPVLNVINEFLPDIMVVQEGYVETMDFIKDNVANMVWIGEKRSQNFVDEYNGIFYRTDRYEMVETKTFALSATPDEIGTMVDDTDQLFPRIVTWGHFRRLADNFEFDVFSTHWDHSGVVGIREEMAVITLEQMQLLGLGRPAFVAGDFNCGIESTPYAVMTGAAEWEGVTGSLIDPWVELGLPEEGTFHGFDGVSEGDRIDWILHNDGFKAVSAEVIKTSYEGIWPSDHFPVGAEFLISKP